MRRDGLRKKCACGSRRWDGCPHDWEFRVKLGGRKRQRVTLDPMTRAAARIEADKKRQALRAAPSLNWKLSDVADKFLEAYPGRHYVSIVKQHLGTMLMSEVTATAVETGAAAHQSNAKHPREGGIGARRHFLTTTRRLFNWAIKHHLAESTPFKRAGVSMIAVPTSGSRHRRLEGDEEIRLLNGADGWTKDMIVAALDTGCRGGELRGLTWADIVNGWIVLRASKTKTKRERRVPVSAALQKILDRRRKGPDGQDLPVTAHVFGNEVGESVPRRLANRRWAATCTAANVVDLHFHDLRHEFGSQLLEAGGDLHEVQAVLGHTNIRMTSTYLNATDTGVQTAMKKLEAKRRRRNLRVVGR